MELAAAVERLVDFGVSGAPVVDDEGRLVGILSEKDCIRTLAAAAYHEAPPGTVGQHMVRRVDTVSPEADLFHVAYHFHEMPYRRLPVVDAAGRLVGLVTRRDLVRGLSRIRRERSRMAQLPSSGS